jgi:hypothetical protein
MDEPTYSDLFTLVFEYDRERFLQSAIRLARRRAREKTLGGLSASQLNGITALTLAEADLEKVKEELQKRGKRRWSRKENSPDPALVLVQDIERLSSDADNALQEVEKKLSTALKAPTAAFAPLNRDWHAELHGRLVRVYLTALVKATIISKERPSPVETSL